MSARVMGAPVMSASVVTAVAGSSLAPDDRQQKE